MGRLWRSCIILRELGYPPSRARGFASPGYPGFALVTNELIFVKRVKSLNYNTLPSLYSILNIKQFMFHLFTGFHFIFKTKKAPSRTPSDLYVKNSYFAAGCRKAMRPFVIFSRLPCVTSWSKSALFIVEVLPEAS